MTQPTEPEDGVPTDASGRFILGGAWVVGPLLGQGGEGSVYEVVEVVGEGARVAGLLPSAGWVAKLTCTPTGLDELATLSKLHHANLATYRGFGVLPTDHELARAVRAQTRGSHADAPVLWVVMDRADASLADRIGEDLVEGRVVAASPIGPEAAEHLWQQLGAGLGHLHDRSIVHGDMKPSNVLAFDDATGTQWRISDFGITVELETGLTRAPAKGWTPAYALPINEVPRVVRPANDWYAAALTVHLAATGHFPERRADGTLLPDAALPAALAADLVRRLNPHLTDEQLAAIAPTLVQGTDPLPPQELEPTSPARRAGWLPAAAAVVLIALLGVGAVLWSGRDDAGTEGPAGAAADAADTAADSAGDAGTGTGAETEGPGGEEATPEQPGTDPQATAEVETSTLVFARRTGGTSTIAAIDPADGEQLPIQLDVDDPTSPSLAPTGALVVVTQVDGRPALAVGGLASTELRVLELDGTVDEPAISPDGRTVAFTTRAGGDRDVATIDLSTGDVTTLAGGSSDEHGPAWSPDGRSIAYVRTGSSSDDIVVIDVATRETTLLDAPAGALRSPTWSPEGDRIAFVATAAGGRDVYRTSLDGAAAATVAALTPVDELDVAWCPEGIVASSSRAGLVLIAEDGSQRDLTTGAGDADPSCTVRTELVGS